MGSIHLVILFLTGFALLDTVHAVCCHVGQHPQSTTDISLDRREKRGSSLLVSYSTTKSTSSNEDVHNETPTQPDKLTKAIIKDERAATAFSPSYSTKPFSRARDQSNSTKLPEAFSTVTDTTVPMETVTNSKVAGAASTVAIIDNKAKRHADRKYDETIDKGIHRAAARPSLKKYTCYCKESECNSNPHCLRDQSHNIRLPIPANPAGGEDYDEDDSENDTSAEEFEESRYAPSHGYLRSIAQMTEPTKFNIPFANNVNFDQRVIIRRKNSNSKGSAHPLYRDSMSQALNLHLYDPHVHRYGTSVNAFAQTQQNNIVENKSLKDSISTDSKMQSRYGLKSLGNKDCMVVNGRTLCAVPSTTMTPINSVETIDLSNDKPIKIHGGRITDPPNPPRTENPIYSPYYGYQVIKPINQNSFMNEKVHFNDPGLEMNPHFDNRPAAGIVEPHGDRYQPGGAQSLSPTQNKEPSYANRYDYSKISNHGSNKPKHEMLHVPTASQSLHKGVEPVTVGPQTSNPPRITPTAARTNHFSNGKDLKHPGCACNAGKSKLTHGSQPVHHQYIHSYPIQTFTASNEKYSAHYGMPQHGSISYQGKYDAWGKSKFNRDTLQQTRHTGMYQMHDMKSYAPDYAEFMTPNIDQEGERYDENERIVKFDDGYQNSRRDVIGVEDTKTLEEVDINSIEKQESERGTTDSNEEHESVDTRTQSQDPSKFSLLGDNVNVFNGDSHSSTYPQPTGWEKIENNTDIPDSPNHTGVEAAAGYFQKSQRTRYESPNSKVNNEEPVSVTQNPRDALTNDEANLNHDMLTVKTPISADSDDNLYDPSQQKPPKQRSEDNLMPQSFSKSQNIERMSNKKTDDPNQISVREMNHEFTSTERHTNSYDYMHTAPEFEDDGNQAYIIPTESAHYTNAPSHPGFLYSTSESPFDLKLVSPQKDFSHVDDGQDRGFIESVGIRYRHPKSIYSYASDYGSVTPQQPQAYVNLQNSNYHSSAYQPILAPMYLTKVHALPVNIRTPYKVTEYPTYGAPFSYTQNNLGSASYQQNTPIEQSVRNYYSQSGVVAQPYPSHNTKSIAQEWLKNRQIGLDPEYHAQAYGQIRSSSGNRGNDYFYQPTTVAVGIMDRDRSKFSQPSFPRSIHAIDQHPVVKSNDSETLFRGLEKIILDNYNMTESSPKFDENASIEKQMHPIYDGPYRDPHESFNNKSYAVSYENRIHPTRPGDLRSQGNTEVLIQSVDDRPSVSLDSNQDTQSLHQNLAVTSESPTDDIRHDDQNSASIHLRKYTNVPHQLENPSIQESIRNSAIHDEGEMLLQNVVKKVINNFVPGEAQDLVVNYETVPEGVMNTEADLHQKILETPVLRRLFSLPDVENMIVDQASTFYSHLTPSKTGVNPHVVKKTFRNIVNQIPPHPTVAPMTKQDSQNHNDQWVTERVTTAMTSLSSSRDASTKEVFDKIKNIINESALDEEVVAQPIVKNLIVKTVKHALDKERGVIDEYTIRQAFDLLVQPRVEKPVATLVEYEKANLAPYPEVTTAVPGNGGQKMAPIFTERTLIGETWVSSVKTLTGLQPNAGSPGFNEERRKALLARLNELEKQQLPADADSLNNEESNEKIDIGTTVSYDHMAEENPVDGFEGDHGGPIYELDRKPIKYYSPNDRILEYIKNHQATPDPSFAMSRPVEFGFTNEYDTKATTQRANVISNSYRTPVLEGLASTNHYYFVTPPDSGREVDGTREGAPNVYRDRFDQQRVQGSNSPSNTGNQWNLLIEATTTSDEPDTRTSQDEDIYNVQSRKYGPGRLPLMPVRYEDQIKLSGQPIGGSYLGRLVPIEYPKSTLSTELRDSDLIWVGDGVRLPLTLRKLTDGTYALTLSDEACKRFENKRCPCCLPSANDGIVVREKRDGGVTKLSFTDGGITESQKFEENPILKGSSDPIARRSKRKFPKENTQKIQFDHEKFLETINKAYEFAKKIIDGDKLGRKDPKRTPYKNVGRFKSYPKSDSISVVETDKYTSRVPGSSTDIKEKTIIADKVRNNQAAYEYSNRRAPYKYQRYAEEDLRIRNNIEALKKLLHFIKNVAIETPDEPIFPNS